MIATDTAQIDLLSFLILSLATFRTSKVLTTDVITEEIRQKVWNRFPPHTKFGYLFTCDWCMSIWTASIITVCYTIVPVATLIVAMPFAFSAVAGLISSKLD